MKSRFLAPLPLFLLALMLSACVENPFVRSNKPVAVEAREVPKPAAQPVQVPQALPDKGLPDLQAGVSSYEDGDYKQSAKQLQSALAQGLDGRGQARARKYLAFMHCVGGRTNQCRDEFRKALEADPGFDLTPAEAGHPTWGPVYRKVKSTMRPVRKSSGQ